ncbi:hypothetical protein BGW38_007020, partial [Lunasporangiospora selenospora]
MPSVTLHNTEDKDTIKRALPRTSQKIITATVARLYVAYPDPNTWTYTGLMGGLAFVQMKNTFYFRIVDLLGSRGVIWEQELYEGFEYTQERMFFHTFALEVMNAAICQHAASKGGLFSSKSKKSKSKGKIDKTQIGLPSDFQHISHVGLDADKGFNLQNVGPQWNVLIEQLKAKGVSQEDIEKNAKFVSKFIDSRG